MYLFVHHICFYSNIFGFETKVWCSTCSKPLSNWILKLLYCMYTHTWGVTENAISDRTIETDINIFKILLALFEWQLICNTQQNIWSRKAKFISNLPALILKHEAKWNRYCMFWLILHYYYYFWKETNFVDDVNGTMKVD